MNSELVNRNVVNNFILFYIVIIFFILFVYLSVLIILYSQAFSVELVSGVRLILIFCFFVYNLCEVKCKCKHILIHIQNNTYDLHLTR